MSGHTFNLYLNENDTVGDMKFKVLDKEMIPVSQQRFIFSGKGM
jgi:hypothetical protein